MAKPQNNPYLLMETEGITKAMLSQKSIKALALYDRASLVSDRQPKSQELKDQADKAGQMACGVLASDITRVKNELRNEAEEEEKKSVKKAQSKKIMEKSGQTLDDLELCRQRLKEDRQRKIESGEITKPKKRTLVTKLRQELMKTAVLIPDKLKDDTGVIERTRKATLKFLNELKNIWGLNRIKPIEDELNEKFKKLQEHAA